MSLQFNSYYKSVILKVLTYFNENNTDHDIEIKRKILLVKLFSTIGFVFLLSFGLSSLFSERYFIASAVIAGSFAAIVIIITICLFLMLTGGVEGTGPLWAYVSVPLVLFLQGEKSGLKILVAFIVVVAIMMFLPSNLYAYTSYSAVFKARFLASYIAVLILSWFHEYARNQAHQRWQELSDYLADQARTDVLTGISNRRDILEKLEYENMRSKRRKENYSVLLIDIDHFKQINDTYGHDAGDMVLKEVSKAIESILFERDLLGRWGGEEFIVVLPDTDILKGSLAAEKIRQRVDNLVINNEENRITVAVSVGLATSDHDYLFYKYIKLADKRLYQAKAQGRNCVVGGLFHLATKSAS